MRVQPRNTAEEAERLARELAMKARQQAMRAVETHGGEAGAAAGGTAGGQEAGERPARQAAPQKREGPKVGRNDPCPCGSGKKYKKCHGAAEAGL